MSKGGDRHSVRIDQFFTGLGARSDQWRNLVELAEAWAKGSGTRAECDAALAEMSATEEFHAYPGPKLMGALRDHAGGVGDRSHVMGGRGYFGVSSAGGGLFWSAGGGAFFAPEARDGYL